MKIRNILIGLSLVLVVLAGCQKGDLTTNPNAGNSASATLLLNAITVRLANGGGYTTSETGSVSEALMGGIYKYDQYYLSNYSYYWGTNTYTWSYSATQYDMLKYVILLEEQAAVQYPSSPTTNIYAGLAKFFRAYSYIWFAERVGDIPASEAGDENNKQPAFDTQKEVYATSLSLLDSANTIIGNLIAGGAVTGSTVVDASGDIFGLTYLQWQKIINAYTIRTLISLSKRADDNTDLNIQSQFAAIVNDPSGHPLPTSNSDNLVYEYNSVNTHPLYANAYNQYINVCKTYLDITTANEDPRTFAVATPAPAQISAGKDVSDFTAYVGADANTGLGDISSNSTAGAYSFLNYNRYFTSSTGANAEPYILIGYPELCFNIAEGINRGWASGDAESWYDAGIDASLSLYDITDGESLTIADKSGTTLGTVTVDLTTFKSNIAYQGGSTGLTQILEQKYVAMFLNSNWQAYYNWRRTGVPSFSEGGEGIGTSDNEIPRRWEYPSAEQTENATNYQSAIQSQFSGTDDVMLDTWLTED
ncbi:SusD/RagB family nutrient-binding outer membrane lipoprotein [Parafilimonas sp.]|uniref:SusD/RagB family nutrient-binding outer membrane lipoprotein n=1 Tax=Parafilimonas sp. TaxID=1969739 RepID=UPI0039E3E2B6